MISPSRRDVLTLLGLGLLSSCVPENPVEETVTPVPVDSAQPLVSTLKDGGNKLVVVNSVKGGRFTSEDAERLTKIFPDDMKEGGGRRLASDLTFGGRVQSQTGWIAPLQEIGARLGLTPNHGVDGVVGRETELVFKLASRLGGKWSIPIYGYDEKKHPHIYNQLTISGLHGLMQIQSSENGLDFRDVPIIGPKNETLRALLFDERNGVLLPKVTDGVRQIQEILSAARAGRPKKMQSYSYGEVSNFKLILKEAIEVLSADINSQVAKRKITPEGNDLLEQFNRYQRDILVDGKRPLSELISHFQKLSILRLDRLSLNFDLDSVHISEGARDTKFKADGVLNGETVARVEMVCPWVAAINLGKGLHTDLALLLTAPVRARSKIGDISLGDCDPAVAVLRTVVQGYSGKDAVFSREMFETMQRYFGLQPDETVLGARFFTRLMREDAEKHGVFYNL